MKSWITLQPKLKETAISFTGVCFGLGSYVLIHKLSGSTDATKLIASSGATAILLFSAPSAPFSQPRNVVFGHGISALGGITSHLLLGSSPFTPVLGVGLGIAGMMITDTVHPPAGGTAILSSQDETLFFLAPVLCGSVSQVSFAYLFNNMVPGRKYPHKW